MQVFWSIYNTSVGTISITSTSVAFRTMTDWLVVSLQGILGCYGNDDEEIGHPDYSNLRFISEVLINPVQLLRDTTFETGFVD